MILATSNTQYWCDKNACLIACAREAEPDKPVITAWRVPMTACCASCGENLYERAARRDAEQATNEADRQLALRIADLRSNYGGW